MKYININESRPVYDFLDAQCIGRKCFHGVKDGDRALCNNRRWRGCPDPLPEFDKETANRNKQAGWRIKK